MMIIIWIILLAFLLIRVLVSLFNAVSNPVLPVYSESEIEKTEALISILIPVRNEESNIGALLSNILNLNDLQRLKYEILVLNDHSTDTTASIVESVSKSNSSVKLLNGKELPKDWLGKNWACHQLAEAASGDYFLFLDADVQLNNGAIENAIHRMKDTRPVLLSLFPDQKMYSFGEQIIVPLMHFLLLDLLPLRLVRTVSFPSLSAANGQFMLFVARVYRQYLFHEKVKSNILDDVNIMRHVKELGLKGEVLLGNNQVFCRMYRNGNEAFKGFSKNLFLGFGKNIFGIQFYFLLIFWLWIPFFVFADYRFIVIALFLIIFKRILISVAANQSIIKNIIYHPLQMCVYTAIAFNSIYIHYNNKVEWKGRRV